MLAWFAVHGINSNIQYSLVCICCMVVLFRPPHTCTCTSVSQLIPGPGIKQYGHIIMRKNVPTHKCQLMHSHFRATGGLN